MKLLLATSLLMGTGTLYSETIKGNISYTNSTEKEIIKEDYEDKYYTFYLRDRADQLIRKGDFLHTNNQFEESQKCFDQAGDLITELSNQDIAYGHLSPDLIAGLCYKKASQSSKAMISFKKCYTQALEFEYKRESDWQFIFTIPVYQEAAYAAFLFGDKDACGEFLFRQMEICSPEEFTLLIAYMDETLLVAKKHLGKSHPIIKKMEQQFEEKTLKDYENLCRSEYLSSSQSGSLIQLFEMPSYTPLKQTIDHLNNKLPRP